RFWSRTEGLSAPPAFLGVWSGRCPTWNRRPGHSRRAARQGTVDRWGRWTGPTDEASCGTPTRQTVFLYWGSIAHAVYWVRPISRLFSTFSEALRRCKDLLVLFAAGVGIVPGEGKKTRGRDLPPVL